MIDSSQSNNSRSHEMIDKKAHCSVKRTREEKRREKKKGKEKKKKKIEKREMRRQ